MVVALVALLMGAPGASAQEGTVWLCEPFSTPNPCHDSLETTIYEQGGGSRVDTPARVARPKVDCFYVYPTVSEQRGPNADKRIEPQQIAIAQYQAARFSRNCRMWAPVYRQLTLAALNGPQEQRDAALEIAYQDVRAAWRDYLKNHSRKRPFVLIGHSQGTRMLRRLITEEIDRDRTLRPRLVSAVLLGGNVVVRKGSDRGGDFQKVPACKRPTQARCVIAFSTFMDSPPSNSRYGRDPDAGTEVLCTNPAALGGGSAPLRSVLRSEPFPGVLGLVIMQMYGGPPPSAPTPWLVPSERYTGECVRDNDANVLKIAPVGSARRLNPAPTPDWGLHLADGNIALGDLVEVVDTQAKAWLAADAKRKRAQRRR